MSNKLVCRATLVLALCIFIAPTFAQGIFDKTADWSGRGTLKAPGKVTFSNGTYTIEGNGDDIWDNQDEGFFVYTEKTGSWSISGKCVWVDNDGHEWSKIGVMIREDGQAVGSRHHYNIVRGQSFGDRCDHGWRDTTGGGSDSVQLFDSSGTAVAVNADGAVWLKLTYRDDLKIIIAEWSHDGTNWNVGNTRAATFTTSTLAYGLCATNHQNNESVAIGEISDVQLAQDTRVLGNRTITAPTLFGSNSLYQPGTVVDVQIVLSNPGAATTINVSETVPSGWAVSAISNGGAASGNVISWNNLAVAAGITTLTYKVTAPANASGSVGFSGTAAGLPIAGNSAISGIAAPVGIFDSHIDIGVVGAAGDATFADGTYTVEGSGADIWGTADEQHFAFKEMSGSFVIKSSFVEFDPGNSGSTWVKVGLMIRDGLEPESTNFFAHTWNDGQFQVRSQYRTVTGGSSAESGTGTTDHDGSMEVVRIGNTFQFYIYSSSGRTLNSSVTIPMQDPVYVGLAVTSHESDTVAGALSTGFFEGVEINEINATVSRTLDDETLPDGAGTRTVTLKLDVADGKTFSGTIRETVSGNATVSGAAASAGNATASGNTVTWTVSNLGADATLTYTVNIPANFNQSFVLISGSYVAGGLDLTVTGSDKIIPIFWDVPFIDRTVTLDGVISPGEYDGAYSEQFGHEDGDNVPPGIHISGNAYPLEDENATFHIFHNRDYIYVAIDVVDKILLDFTGNTTDAWQNDSTELYIDGDLSRLATKNNNRLGFQATVVGDGHFLGGNDAPTPVQLPNGGYASTNGAYWNMGAKAKDDETGYIVEYQVIKSQVLDPPDRTVIGFDILMNSGEGTGARTGKWGYWNTKLETPTSDAEHWNDERGWAVVQLVGQPAPVGDWSIY